MSAIKSPRSLRGERVAHHARQPSERAVGTSLAFACIAAGGGAAQAQTQPSTLPTMVVDAPVVKRRPVAAPKPSAAHVRARAAIRQRARAPAAATPAPAAPSPAPVPAFARLPSDNPYAQAGSPYKVNRLQSKKFSEPIANTPRTITVLSKEVLEDKGATSLRELGRSTAGVTLGTGEGGNAFGDRFFIRGFDTRNDVFLDGIRDPAVSVRENFFTEQVEILRGPASSFAGRGTAGGAINIVTKKANTDGNFRIMEGTGSPTDRGGRFTVDVNQAINSDLAVRVNGLYQNQKIPGRDFVTDNRAGASVSVVYKPIEPLKISLDYIHTDLWGLPDFGVPYNRFGTNRPFTEGFTNRNLWYGFVNRDFQKIRQDIGTAGVEYQLNDHVTLSSRFRRQQSLLDYVGTLAQGASFATAIPGGQVNLSPQSRYQQTAVIASQNDATIKFDTGPVMHTSVVGTEISHEQITRDSYTGLSSELFGGGAFNGNGTAIGGILFPPNLLPFNTKPTLAGNPTNIVVDSKSAYLIHTANYNDFIIVNGGLRMDDYRISSYSPTVAAAAVFNPGVPALVNNFYNAYAGAHSTLFNYNGGLVVKPLPGWSLYAAYATSANPVGAELDGSAAAYGALNAASQILAPEKNKSVEVGSKLELFDKRLLLTAALFQTTKTNAREVFGTNVYGSGAYEIRGIDLGVNGKITDRWSVFGGLVFMHSKVTQSKAPSNVGLALANLAHASFSLLSKYQLTDELELGGQAVYNSRRYGGSLLAANGGAAISTTTFLPAPTAANPFLNVPTVLPSYWRFDAFAEYKITQNVTAKVQAINLFNRTYYDAFYQSAAPFAQIAPGRSVQFSVKATF
ncbi:MAG: TonB-dependent receptor [Rhodoblastus sp.]|jgi:catecholate siderophore receptor